MALHTMRAGYSHRQGGAYPPFQHESDVYPHPSPRGNNVTPAPVGHPHLSNDDDDGMHVNMVESHRNGGVEAVNASAQRQQDDAQGRQIFHGRRHQPMLQARRESPGFQHLYSFPARTANSPALNGGDLGVSVQSRHYSSAGKVLRKSPMQYTSRMQDSPSTSTEQTNGAVKTQPPTDDQIQEFITKRLNDLKAQRPNTADHPHHSTSSASDRERHTVASADQRTAGVGRALQKNCSTGSNANAEFTVKAKGTEYPQIMAKVAATCTKNEDKSPSVVPMSKNTWNEKGPSLTLNRSPSKVSQLAVNRTTEKQKGDADLKLVEAVELDNVQDGTVSEHLRTKSRVATADKPLVHASVNCEKEDTNKDRTRGTEEQHCPLNCEEAIPPSKKKPSGAPTHNVTSAPTDQSELHEDVMETAGSGSSQTYSRHTRSQKIQNPPGSPESRCEEAFICKDPQYISDEDKQIEMPSFTQAGESTNKQSPLKNVHKRVQGRAHTCAGGTDDPPCDHERRVRLGTNQCAPCSPSSLLIDEDGTDDEMDNDDDGYIVIPISLTDIKFEAADKARDVRDAVLGNDEDRRSDTSSTRSDLHCPVPNPEAASAFPTLEVFDTPLCFMRAKTMHTDQGLVLESNRTTRDREVQSKGQRRKRRARTEPSPEHDDSCDTEDSCDYSSASEHNYLTVPKHMFKKRSKPLPSDSDDAESDQESKHDEARNVGEGEATTSVTSQKLTVSSNDIIIIDSDTDDHSDQNRKVDTASRRNGAPAASSPARQHQPDHLKAPPEPVKHPNKEESSHSCSEDDRQTASKRKGSHDSSKISKKKNMSMVSPGSKDDGNASIAVQRRLTSESRDDLYGPVNKKLKDNDSPKKQPQSVRRLVPQHSLGGEKEKAVPKPKPANDAHCTAKKVQTKGKQPTWFSRQLSLPSTSSSSLAIASGQRPEARRSSEWSQSGEEAPSSSPPAAMQSTSVSRRQSSPTGRKRSDSFCTSSTLDHRSNTKRLSSNAPIQSSWEKMRKYWSDNYFPTRRDRKSSAGPEKALRPTCSEPRGGGRPRPRHNEKAHRQRHSSHESATPLMKRSMMEARELTKARNRDVIRGPRPYE